MSLQTTSKKRFFFFSFLCDRRTGEYPLHVTNKCLKIAKKNHETHNNASCQFEWRKRSSTLRLFLEPVSISAGCFSLGVCEIKKKPCRNGVSERDLGDRYGVPGITKRLPVGALLSREPRYIHRMRTFHPARRDRDVSARSSELKVSASARIVKS